MTPVLSLVTGTINRPQSFERLLVSVVLNTTVPYEFIVGDASEIPHSVDGFPHVQLHHENPRLGHSKGYNKLFAMCKGKYTLYLNDDAEVTEGYDTLAVDFMEAHPNIGLGCLLYSENGGPFHVNSSWKTMYANFGILPTEFGKRIGWFDEDIEMYGADNSLAFRVLLAGKGIAAVPHTRILHHSVNDAMRKANQVNRLRDNRILTQKYMPLRNEWQAAYERHVISSTEPWDHGRQPAAR